jgi:hypothetical protein
LSPILSPEGGQNSIQKGDQGRRVSALTLTLARDPEPFIYWPKWLSSVAATETLQQYRSAAEWEPDDISSFRVLPPMSSRPEEFHLRALPEPCMTLSSHTAPDVRRCLNGFASPTGSSRFRLANGQAEQRSPFAPAPLKGLRHYHGLLRPCARLRYSRPRGWSRLRLVPSRYRRDEAQVLTFHTKAWSSFAPPTCRMPLGQYQGVPRADPGGRVTPRF